MVPERGDRDPGERAGRHAAVSWVSATTPWSTSIFVWSRVSFDSTTRVMTVCVVCRSRDYRYLSKGLKSRLLSTRGFPVMTAEQGVPCVELSDNSWVSTVSAQIAEAGLQQRVKKKPEASKKKANRTQMQQNPVRIAVLRMLGTGSSMRC
jgi:hypothetical protein